MKRSSKIKSLNPLSLVLLCLLLTQWGTLASAETIGEGPARTGSDAYRDAGADGSGITIAIIDNAFASLTASQASGDTPPQGGISLRSTSRLPYKEKTLTKEELWV